MGMNPVGTRAIAAVSRERTDIMLAIAASTNVFESIPIMIVHMLKILHTVMVVEAAFIHTGRRISRAFTSKRPLDCRVKNGAQARR